jgi:hypothetical protein
MPSHHGTSLNNDNQKNSINLNKKKLHTGNLYGHNFHNPSSEQKNLRYYGQEYEDI